jgi:radical SAM protein with 4Fe4S-binding SPASM domain
MRRYVDVKINNKYVIFPIGNFVGKMVFEVNQMGHDILKKMYSGMEDFAIAEGYVNLYPSVPTVKNDVMMYINSIRNFMENSTRLPEELMDFAQEKDIQHKNETLEIQQYYVENNMPYKVFLELTYNCNLRCPHCYVQEDITKHEKFRDKKEIFRLLDELEASGVVDLHITGGEASLHPDFVEILQYATSKNMLITVLTNGQNIYDKKLMEQLIECPLYEVRISLYGDKEYHDAFVKRKGAFDKSVAVLEELRRKKGIGTGTYVITNQNYIYFDQLKLYLEKKGIPLIFSPVIMPTTHGDKSPIALRLNKEQLREVVAKHAATLHGATCTAGISRFRITPYGVVNPCEMMRDVNLGNVYEDGFAEVMKAEARQKWLEKFYKILKEHTCNSCKVRSRCNMCPGLFYVENGDYMIKSDFLCKYAAVRKEIQEERDIKKQCS